MSFKKAKHLKKPGQSDHNGGGNVRGKAQFKTMKVRGKKQINTSKPRSMKQIMTQGSDRPAQKRFLTGARPAQKKTMALGKSKMPMNDMDADDVMTMRIRRATS